jgi:putative transposase
MKTYKFKFYQHKRNRYLKRTINASASIYNHCIALHKRYYRLFGKTLNCAKLQKHIAKLRNRNPYWQLVGSQAVQDICQRIERGYKLFFDNHKKGVRPPNFKASKKYKSFTLKQAGYKFLGGNRIKIGSKVYQFWNPQNIEGKIKTVTIKRVPTGDLHLIVVTDALGQADNKFKTGKIAGFDFGLKTFLTTSDNEQIASPLFLKTNLKALKKLSKALSSKRKGSNNRNKARLNLARLHEDITNQRRDFFWKLAHRLTDEYDYLFLENLCLKGMVRLWGRKVSDLAFSEFLEILKWVALKKDKVVHFIDRWYPSSKTCSNCGHVLEKLELDTREWRCPSCQQINDRDENAAINIKNVGASTFSLGDVSRSAKIAIAA